MGSRWGGLFFLRGVVQLVGCEGSAHHHSRRCRLMEVGLKTRPECMARCAGQPQRAGEAGCRLALRQPAPSQHQGSRALSGFRKDRPGPQGSVAIAGPTATGGTMALGPEQAPLGGPTGRTDQTLRVERRSSPRVPRLSSNNSSIGKSIRGREYPTQHARYT